MMKGRAKANVNTLLPITVFDRSLNLDNLGFKRFEVAGVAAAGVEFTLKISMLIYSLKVVIRTASQIITK